MSHDQENINEFLKEWPSTSEPSRRAFEALLDCLRQREDTRLEFYARPGVTYSLRAVRSGQTEQPLFAMVDVIDDEPRWLSVCFYGQAVADPSSWGDYVPGGLLGEDGICFDVETPDEERLDYLKERIAEAHAAAR